MYHCSANSTTAVQHVLGAYCCATALIHEVVVSLQYMKFKDFFGLHEGAQMFDKQKIHQQAAPTVEPMQPYASETSKHQV